MGLRRSHEPGTFSWVDLATTDATGAKAFYRGLFGWEAVDMPAVAGTYTMCHLDGVPVAALYGEQDGAPRWNSYVTVEDVDATAARVAEVGGTLLGDPFDVEEAGRMAVVHDPAGAVLMLWQARGHIGAGRVNDSGCLCWNQLRTPDADAATRFYGALLDWEFRPSGGRGTLIMNRGRLNGGLNEDRSVLTGWHVFFTVESADEAAERAVRLGGRVLEAPETLPVGRFATIADPQGAAFDVFEGETDD
jgi:predicted enzyme related to lactoylglutathione lyase